MYVFICDNISDEEIVTDDAAFLHWLNGFERPIQITEN